MKVTYGPAIWGDRCIPRQEPDGGSHPFENYNPPPKKKKNNNMSPENQWLVQMYFLLKIGPFQETTVSFQGCSCFNCMIFEHLYEWKFLWKLVKLYLPDATHPFWNMYPCHGK